MNNDKQIDLSAYGLPNGPWTYEFIDLGGYDCMSDCFHIEQIKVSIDGAHFGQQPCGTIPPERKIEMERIAHAVTLLPRIIKLLEISAENTEALANCYGTSCQVTDERAMHAAVGDERAIRALLNELKAQS